MTTQSTRLPVVLFTVHVEMTRLIALMVVPDVPSAGVHTVNESIDRECSTRSALKLWDTRGNEACQFPNSNVCLLFN